ncbi:MAG: Fic family protein [Parcubacteria group bacterium]|nr:Fic family protein [Parcubacteria group bacterium]
MKYLNTKFVERLEKKLQRLNALRSLPKSAVQKLQEQLRIEMTYNSNAIEGNSLTLKETFLVVIDGITVKGKPLKDHLEAKDHHAALEYLYDLVEKDTRHTISERLIRTVHQLIMQETDKEWAGRYRNANVMITGANHIPPDVLGVPQHMHELIEWTRKNGRVLHSIEYASLFHHKIAHIHPFFDGNGRTARIMMNVLLMQSGFPLVVVLKNDRKKYYTVLDKADKGNYTPLVRFIAQAVERSLDMYLKVLTPTTQKRETYLPLSELATHTSYSAKYLNLLARLGKLEAHKERRNWLASKEAVERYMKSRDRQRDVGK